MIVTTRLALVPATVELARAELRDRPEFARLLSATVPDEWPPESAADALPLFLSWLEAAPGQSGWFGWYALALNSDEGSRVLVGSGGFLGPPQAGEVRVGYSVLPPFQGHGYATEMVRALMAWALGHSEVHRILAETEWENARSVRVLAKSGFRQVGERTRTGGARFEWTRGT